jgi:UDP-2,3-diacylglucosamine pyrophosphatase LpxH
MDSTFIISDLHLGSEHCRHAGFLRFLDSLPAQATLLMNGDIVHRVHHALPAEHQDVLERLAEESGQRRVVWIWGNHDDGYVPKGAGSIEFVSHFEPLPGVHVAHGHDFDNLMPRNRWFILLFRFFHGLRMRLGAEPVHVAYYAKRFRVLYGVLRRHVLANSVEHARETGCRTVICGHTHYPEELTAEGVRYINTGSWTEEPLFYAVIEKSGINLRQV